MPKNLEIRHYLRTIRVPCSSSSSLRDITASGVDSQVGSRQLSPSRGNALRSGKPSPVRKGTFPHSSGRPPLAGQQRGAGVLPTRPALRISGIRGACARRARTSGLRVISDSDAEEQVPHGQSRGLLDAGEGVCCRPFRALKVTLSHFLGLTPQALHYRPFGPLQRSGDWLLEEPWHESFEFRCDVCALLSNIPSSLMG